MTRKDYQLIADSIHRSAIAKSIDGNAVRREAARSALRLVVIALAANLGQTNPAFDRDRFMTACGMSA